MILEVMSFGLLETNGILLGSSSSKKCVLIDAPEGSAQFFLKRIEALGLKAQMVLFTHSHWDHVVDAHEFKSALNVPFYIEASEGKNLEYPGSDGLQAPFPIEGVKPDGFLQEGQVLEVGDLMLEVIETPGHSPGGVCFYLKKEALLISGDTLFRSTIGRLDLPHGQKEKMWESLKKLSKLPSATRVIPGHGEETTIGDEKELLLYGEKYFGG